MAKVKELTQREAFGNYLRELGEKDERIFVFDADLACCTYGNKFGETCPRRYYNVGIAEANMICMAAGVATTGKIAFACSFAMFTAGRGYDQIRNSLAYPNLNVKVIGTYAGLTVGEDGATHQCIEDMAIMRAIPNMVVLNPADINETLKATDAIIAHDGPVYMRLPRVVVDEVTANTSGYSFELGKGAQLKDGKDATVIATGLMVQQALLAAKLLDDEGISIRVIDMHTVKPIDADIIEKAARETGAIVTAEEHNVLGGLGGAVAEVVVESCPVPMLRVGVEDKFGKSGDASLLMQEYGLTAKDIADKVKRVIAKK